MENRIRSYCSFQLYQYQGIDHLIYNLGSYRVYFRFTFGKKVIFVISDFYMNFFLIHTVKVEFDMLPSLVFRLPQAIDEGANVLISSSEDVVELTRPYFINIFSKSAGKTVGKLSDVWVERQV